MVLETQGPERRAEIHTLGWGVAVGCFLVATPAEGSTGMRFASVAGFPTPAAASRVTTSMMIHTRKYFDLSAGATRLIRL